MDTNAVKSTDHLCIDGRVNKLYSAIVGHGPVVICFDQWTQNPDITAPPFGFAFWKSRGANVVAVKSGVNDWYQGAEMPAILAAIDEMCGDRERIGYGSSMGAYAVLNFSTELRISQALLFAPQFSIDRSLVPFERRWTGEFERTKFVRDQVAVSRPIERGAIFFDPREIDDGRHIALISVRHPLPIVKVPFSSHSTIQYFSTAGALARLAEEVVFHGIPVEGLIAKRRALRLNSSLYWTKRSQANHRRKRFALALEDALRAETLPKNDSAFSAHLRATALWGMHQRDAAIAIWRAQTSDPNQAPVALRRIQLTAREMRWGDLRREFDATPINNV